MFTRIIVGFYAMLLALFPWSPYVRANYQEFSYVGDKVICEQVIEAIENKDVDTIKNMLSKTEINKLENPDAKIKEFIDYFNGRNITYSKYFIGDSDSIRPLHHSKMFHITFYENNNEYRIKIGWVVKDAENPENVGMEILAISDRSGTPKIIYNINE